MTERNEIYKCEVCGNIITVLHESFGELVCCGKPMLKLDEKTSEQNIGEKHVPVVEDFENTKIIKVGSQPHPMTEEHFIEFIEAIGDDELHIKFLKPNVNPEYKLTAAGNFIAKEYCNLHGLWSNKNNIANL